MDFSTVVANNRKIDIVHPSTGDKMGLRIELRPKSSKEVRAQQRKNSDEKLNSGRKKLGAKWLEESYDKVLVASIAGWEWTENEDGEMGSFKGEQPECTPQKVEELFAAAPWLRDQVDEAYSDSEAFFTA